MYQSDSHSGVLLPPSPSPKVNLFVDLVSLLEEDPKIHEVEYKKRSALFGSPGIEIMGEAKCLLSLAFPIAATGLILYSRSMVSMLFLGHLGDMELAGGSLAIAFANITGYSVLSGLALGMEPLCSQAFGAHRPKLLSLTLHRSLIFLLLSSIPISLLWLNVSKILLFLHQDPTITKLAHTYLIFSLPDLVSNSFIHPIRIYLRAQGITQPLTLASLAASLFHLPINFLLVSHFRLGIAGVALASAAANFLLLMFLISYLRISGLLAHPTWTPPTLECLTGGWTPLLKLAAPSCVSVCLEWWWYEIMILLCGLLDDPSPAVASMGLLIQTTSFIYIFPSSLGFAVSSRVGNQLGANRPAAARLSAALALFMALLMGLSATAFALAMRNRWAPLFTDDLQILRLTSLALPILGLCEIGNCPQTVACGVLRGTARPSAAARINLGAFYLVGMPVAVGLGLLLGVGFSGLWLGLLSAQVSCAGLMLYAIGSTDWNLEAERSKELTSGVVLNGSPDTATDEDVQQNVPLTSVLVTSVHQ